MVLVVMMRAEKQLCNEAFSVCFVLISVAFIYTYFVLLSFKMNVNEKQKLRDFDYV